MASGGLPKSWPQHSWRAPPLLAEEKKKKPLLFLKGKFGAYRPQSYLAMTSNGFWLLVLPTLRRAWEGWSHRTVNYLVNYLFYPDGETSPEDA